MITMGMLASTEPAMTMAGWPTLLTRETNDNQSWTVKFSWLRRKTSGCRKSFQVERKTKMDSEARAGRMIGRTMRVEDAELAGAVDARRVEQIVRQ